MDQQNPLIIGDILEKLEVVEAACHEALCRTPMVVPDVVARDVEVRSPKELPSKNGMNNKQGQARLLHDLASIELQAMEMAFRTLAEFPHAPEFFRQELVDLVLDEARHLELCLKQIEHLGFSWGDWPVHISLWQCLSKEDSLLDRLLIVHRYLEGSGLDASDKISRRLDQIADKETVRVIKTIAEEELGHVQFGSRWYNSICQEMKLDPDEDFKIRTQKLYHRLPRRLEAINRELRIRAGFSLSQIETLKQIQRTQRNWSPSMLTK